MATVNTKAYKRDFYAWTIHNAQLIRQGKLSEVDLENVAEELESMGKSDKRELVSRFAILLAHLLKWHFQPSRRGNSWQYTIAEQRDELIELLEDSPSLKHELEQQLSRAYKRALLITANETGMNINDFPKKCPFSLAQALDANFLPDEKG